MRILSIKPVEYDWKHFFARLRGAIECDRSNIFIRFCSVSSDFEQR
jgi:hypothetical protein